MSKAMLVIDMPENCLCCPIGEDHGDYYIYCPIVNKVPNNNKKRPEYCPLQAIPDEVFENRPRSMEIIYKGKKE